MKILAAIKRVPDFKAVIRIKADQSGIETANVKMTMNPFDEIAVEEAVRLKERGTATEIVVVSIGDILSQDILRVALAMGADRGILVQLGAGMQLQDIHPLIAAKILKAIVIKESPQLIMMGKQAIDTDNNQTGQMLAGLLNWSQGTFASKLEFENAGVRVMREVDNGLETLFLKLPAVITTDLRLNEPRYLSLPNIMSAKRKPVDIVSVSSLGVDMVSRLKYLKMAVPEKHRAGIHVKNAAELIYRLKEEAKVLL